MEISTCGTETIKKNMVTNKNETVSKSVLSFKSCDATDRHADELFFSGAEKHEPARCVVLFAAMSESACAQHGRVG